MNRYVAQKDSVYGWKLVRTVPGKGFQTYVLELTSQSWRTEKDVDRPVWKHWLTIVRPDNIRSNKALLFIGGGNNDDPKPSKASDRVLLIATEAGTVVAELAMVPNQPLHFTDSPQKARSTGHNPNSTQKPLRARSSSRRGSLGGFDLSFRWS
jgi:PhoPQ-activated pathogenicity-related protein